MHPSYLKVSSNDDYSLDSLALTSDSYLPPLPGRHAYTSQAVLFGPDAAVEVRNGKIALYMHGAITENLAFKEFVEEQAYAVHRRVAGLIADPKDVLTFIGKWYHVDYDQDPFFRPYVIKILRANGLVEFLPSKEDIFWTDEDNSYFSCAFIEPGKMTTQPASLFRETSEECIRGHILHPFDSGFNSFGGILWHATTEGHQMVYVPLEGTVTHRTKEIFNGLDVDPKYVQPFKILDAAISAFKSCLRDDIRGSSLIESRAVVAGAIAALPGEYTRAEARDQFTTLLGDYYLDTDTGNLVEKRSFPTSASIKLGQIPLETKARGCWFVQRDGPFTAEDEPNYLSFLHGVGSTDLDIVLSRSAPVSIEGYDGTCAYASEWIAWERGEFRYLAFGPERTLSW